MFTFLIAFSKIFLYKESAFPLHTQNKKILIYLFFIIGFHSKQVSNQYKQINLPKIYASFKELSHYHMKNTRSTNSLGNAMRKKVNGIKLNRKVKEKLHGIWKGNLKLNLMRFSLNYEL